MLKSSLVLIVLFASHLLYAGPQTGPIVPWPTATLMESAEKAALAGAWVAYDSNAIWLIEIDKEPTLTDTYQVRVYSHALFKNYGFGQVKFDKRAFWGTIYTDPHHAFTIYIFRDTEGNPKMRLGSGRNWHDLDIYRDENHD